MTTKLLVSIQNHISAQYQAHFKYLQADPNIIARCLRIVFAQRLDQVALRGLLIPQKSSPLKYIQIALLDFGPIVGC